MLYTDPSGELIDFGVAVLIGAGVAALFYVMTAALTDIPFSVGGLLKATFIGAASAAVTFGIGSGAENLFSNFYSKAAFQAVAHGTFQGGMTAISGGKFWSGFASGALSSIAASVWSGGTTETTGFSKANNWAYGAKTITHAGLGAGTGTAGMIAFGTIMGGAGAALTGGNFWQGAVTGLVVSGLNHGGHDGPGPDNTSVQENPTPLVKSYLDSWINKNQYFSGEIGARFGTYLDFSPIKKVFGVRIGEYREFSRKIDYDIYNRASYSYNKNHYFEIAASYGVGASFKYNIGESRFESVSGSFFGASVELSLQSNNQYQIFLGVDTGIGMGIGMGGFTNIKGGWKFNF